MPPKTPSTPTDGKTQAKLTSFFAKTPKTDEPEKKTFGTEKPVVSSTKTPPRAPSGASNGRNQFSTPKALPSKSPKDGHRATNGRSAAKTNGAEKSPAVGAAMDSNQRRARVLESPESCDDTDLDPDFQEFEIEFETESEAPSDVPESEVEAESEADEDSSPKAPQKRKKSAGAQNGNAKRKAVSVPKASASKPSTVAKKIADSHPAASSKKGKATSSTVEANGEHLPREVGDIEDNSNDGEVVDKHTHEELPWLYPDVIKDKTGKLHKDIVAEGLVPRTLKVPASFLDNPKECTPALRQWWHFKADNYDTVLFFKLGKFYEMYHMDADVGVKELDLIYMRGYHAHCGFPEGAMSWKANRLVAKGYKVARIEQMMSGQQFKDQKDTKVMPREIIRILSPGTQSVSLLESEIKNDEYAEKNALKNPSATSASCLLALCEKCRTQDDGSEVTDYGVCVLYPGPGTFLIGQFREDRYHSRLRTLLAHHSPTELLLERSRTSTTLMQMLRTNTESSSKEFLVPGTEFLEAKETIRVLLEGEYFGPIMEPAWPERLAGVLDMEGSSLPTSKPEYELAFRALGACVWYLRRCRIDFDMLSLKNFDVYVPSDQPMSTSAQFQKKNMVLDGVTLINLDILPAVGSNPDACLLKKMDRCKTKFGMQHLLKKKALVGRRLLKEWVVSPLYRIADILDRQKAVKEVATFRANQDREHTLTIKTLQSLPDLERLLSKVHIAGSLKRSQNHPESRCSMFDEKIYGKRKIQDFVATLEGFQKATKSITSLSSNFAASESRVLRDLIAGFPNLKEILDHFAKAFDVNKAAEEGKITPVRGVDEQFDQALKAEHQILDQLEKYRMDQSKELQCKIQYFHQARNRFQMEIADDKQIRIPSNFERKSQRKGFIRYWTGDIERILAQLVYAEEKREAAAKDCTRRVFEKFDSHYAEWMKAVRCISVLDVLFSLEEYSSNLAQSCVPVFRESTATQKPFIAVRDGRHPLVVSTYSGGEFIPNDSYVGVAEPDGVSGDGSVVLITGPNMGGKSTLMRQTGLIAILAQLGSKVPASFCEMTPVDRIFTRIGASDNLLAGESTFFVELSETSSILQHATEHSLVLIDELGRGTATFDGTAIAAAVLKDLATRIRCRTLFSTHYHSLVGQFGSHPSIKLGHLACLVENDNDEDPTQETITFLYKLAAGACPKSYGFNAARLAGLPDKIVKRAHTKSVELEKLMQLGEMRLKE